MQWIFILHADHEQNASTSTVRLAGSSQANPFACIFFGDYVPWDRRMVAQTKLFWRCWKKSATLIAPEYIEKAKDKDDPFRLMGFGIVFKNYDPRAGVLKASCDEVLDELGVENEPLLEIARELEKIALQDPYFVDRKLFPNVDFYSGIILKAIGIPTSMFTVTVLARTVGWISLA